MLAAVDHVQLAAPPGTEDFLRVYYVHALGMTEIPKPPVLAAQGDHGDQGLGVQGGELRVEAAALELAAQDVLHLGGDVRDERGEGTRRLRDGGVADEDAETVRVLLDVVEEREGGLFAQFP